MPHGLLKGRRKQKSKLLVASTSRTWDSSYQAEQYLLKTFSWLDNGLPNPSPPQIVLIVPDSAYQLRHIPRETRCVLVLPAKEDGTPEDFWRRVLTDSKTIAVVLCLSRTAANPPPDIPSHWSICRGMEELFATTSQLLAQA